MGYQPTTYAKVQSASVEHVQYWLCQLIAISTQATREGSASPAPTQILPISVVLNWSLSCTGDHIHGGGGG